MCRVDFCVNVVVQRTFRAVLSLRRQLQLAKANGDAQGQSSVLGLLCVRNFPCFAFGYRSPISVFVSLSNSLIKLVAFLDFDSMRFDLH